MNYCREAHLIRKWTGVAVLLITMALLFNAAKSNAQSAMLTLPDASQAARITQSIGITDIIGCRFLQNRRVDIFNAKSTQMSSQ